MPLDYYKILGVNHNSSDDEIKKQYRRLARKYHPDVSKLKNAEKRFKEINEAYDVLKNKQKRSNYDRFGSADGNPFQGGGFTPPPRGGSNYQGSRQAGDFGGFGQGSFSDIFDKMFNPDDQSHPGQGDFSGAGGFTSQSRNKAQTEQTIEVSVSLEDVYQGTDKTFRLTLPGQKIAKRLKVKIPKGIKEGQKIRLSKQGHHGADLYLKIKFKKHHLFILENNDIHLNIPITVWEAALGTTLSIPTLGGTVEMKIPAASQSGKKLRLKGRGLGKTPGDQYVTLLIKLESEPNQEMEKLYQKMKKISQFNPRENF
ncbi:MAG: DnaJ C-terminal domain-containing protein [Pseudomonadota bacterium]